MHVGRCFLLRHLRIDLVQDLAVFRRDDRIARVVRREGESTDFARRPLAR